MGATLGSVQCPGYPLVHFTGRIGMKYRHPDTWYQRAAHSLASGARQEDVAKECEVGVRTLKRHLGAPGSVLSAMVQQEKAKLAGETADQRSVLLDKAL